MKGKVVAITGASGFIGRHLCRRLMDDAAEVHGLSRSECGISGAGFRWHEVDLADFDATRTALSSIGADLIFHLCSFAQGERDLALVMPTFHSELQAAVNLLTSVAETKLERLIMIRSLEEPSPGETPTSPYAAAKASSWAYARMFHQLYGLPVVAARIFMTYGPGQSTKKMIPHVIGRMLRNEPLTLRSPQREVDWIYIDDVVSGLIATAVTPGLEGKSVDLGSGNFVKISEVAERIQHLIKSRSAVEYGRLPKNIFEEVRRADVATTTVMTGWAPSVSLDAGLAKTVEHFSAGIVSPAGAQQSAHV